MLLGTKLCSLHWPQLPWRVHANRSRFHWISPYGNVNRRGCWDKPGKYGISTSGPVLERRLHPTRRVGSTRAREYRKSPVLSLEQSCTDSLGRTLCLRGSSYQQMKLLREIQTCSRRSEDPILYYSTASVQETPYYTTVQPAFRRPYTILLNRDRARIKIEDTHGLSRHLNKAL